MVSEQKLKKVVGEAYENLVIEHLESIRCYVAERHRAMETGEALPDLYAYCGGKLMRIEVKEALAEQKDVSMPGEVREGRFILSERIVPKECYAFGIDDRKKAVVTTDFVRAEDPDEFVRTHGKRPKYPISRLYEIRDKERCFPHVGTLETPRERLLQEVEEVASSWRQD